MVSRQDIADIISFHTRTVAARVKMRTKKDRKISDLVENMSERCTDLLIEELFPRGYSRVEQMLALTEDGESLNEEVAAVLNESLKIFEEERREWLKRPGGYTEADFLAHDPVYSQVEGGIVVRSFRRLDRFEVEILIDEGYPAFSLYDHNRWYKIRRLYLRGAEILDFYVPDFFLAKDNREDIRKFVWSEFEVKKFQDD